MRVICLASEATTDVANNTTVVHGVAIAAKCTITIVGAAAVARKCTIMRTTEMRGNTRNSIMIVRTITIDVAGMAIDEAAAGG